VASAAFPLLRKEAVQDCLRGKRVLFAGDSTTRDTYTTLASLAGTQEAGKYGRMERSRDTATLDGTRLSFQFLGKGNDTADVERGRRLLADRKADVVFVQCFMYDNLFYMAGREEGMGEACMQYLEAVVGFGSASSPPVYLLGSTYPPNWVDPYENRTRAGSVMERIFRSINSAAGITCKHTAKNGYYAVVSSRGIRGPIDRYNIVGHRKPDRIHPHPNAQQAIVRMIIRHMCPTKDVADDPNL